MFLFIGDKMLSSWSMRARIIMAEFGAPATEILVPLDFHVNCSEFEGRVDFRHVDLDRPEPATGCVCEVSQLVRADPTGLIRDSVFAATGRGRVPVLVDERERVVLYDVLAMHDYLVEASGTDPLLPKERSARFEARGFAHHVAADLLAVQEQLSYPLSFRNVNADLLDASVCAQAEEFLEELEWLCSRTGRAGFLFGEFSIADVMVAPIAQSIRGWKIDTSGVPRARQYLERVLERPSVAQHLREAEEYYLAPGLYREDTPAWVAHHYRFHLEFRLIHNVRTNICHKLENEVAMRLYSLAREGRSLRDIAQDVAEAYEIDVDRACRDAEQFFEAISPRRDPLHADSLFVY